MEGRVLIYHIVNLERSTRVYAVGQWRSCRQLHVWCTVIESEEQTEGGELD